MQAAAAGGSDAARTDTHTWGGVLAAWSLDGASVGESDAWLDGALAPWWAPWSDGALDAWSAPWSGPCRREASVGRQSTRLRRTGARERGVCVGQSGRALGRRLGRVPRRRLRRARAASVREELVAVLDFVVAGGAVGPGDGANHGVGGQGLAGVRQALEARHLVYAEDHGHDGLAALVNGRVAADGTHKRVTQPEEACCSSAGGANDAGRCRRSASATGQHLCNGPAASLQFGWANGALARGGQTARTAVPKNKRAQALASGQAHVIAQS